MLHCARSRLIGQRTEVINAVCGHLSEFGIVAERGLLGFAELSSIVRDEKDPWRSCARQIRPDKHPWITKLLSRMSAKQAAIVITNKTARIAWAVMVRGAVYEAAISVHFT